MLDEQQKKSVISIAQIVFTNTIKTSSDVEGIKKRVKDIEGLAQSSLLIAEAFVKIAKEYQTKED